MRPTLRHVLAGCVAAALLAGCNDAQNKRTQQQLESLQKKNAAAKEAAKDGPVLPLPREALSLPAPWDERDAVVITPEGRCPDGLWALFDGPAPGADDAEKKANAANRASIAEGLRNKPFLVRMKGASYVTLSDWDATHGLFVVEVKGTVDCVDPLGRIAIAFGPAKAQVPGASAAQQGSDFVQQVWTAAPITFEKKELVPSEAKRFFDGNRFGLSARVAFAPGATRVDTKVRRVPKVTEKVGGETLSIGGGTEDWGAGRLLEARQVAVRVATDGERTQLFERR